MPDQVTTSEASKSTFEWYSPGPSVAAFHRSKARTRALIGARGSGKTTAWIVEALSHAFNNPGAKIYVLRKTQSDNSSTTQESFEQVLRQCGSAYIDTGYSLFKKIDGGTFFRLPSREAVEKWNMYMRTNPNKTQQERWLESEGNKWCSFVHFAGCPDPSKQAGRFRGYEASLLVFVEGDELTLDDWRMALFCLRWKNAYGNHIEDTSCIIDTNPPSPDHWIAKLEEESKNDEETQFWHIPIYENEHNLPAGYVKNAEQTYGDNPAMFKRMVLGLYAHAFDGHRVFWAFREQHAYEDLPWPRGAYLVRGWDFGTTQAVVWSAYFEENGDEFWWDMLEYFAMQSDVEKQAREVLRLTQEAFPFWNDRNICAGVLDFCDPAGAAQTDKGRSIDTLNSYGIHPGYSTKYRSLPLTLSIYNRLLEKKDASGKYVYRICKKSCPSLYLASLGGYRYPEKGEVGFGKDEPGKGPQFGNFDHIADASRYAKVNCLRLARSELEKMQRPVGILAKASTPNRARRWF